MAEHASASVEALVDQIVEVLPTRRRRRRSVGGIEVLVGGRWCVQYLCRVEGSPDPVYLFALDILSTKHGRMKYRQVRRQMDESLMDGCPRDQADPVEAARGWSPGPDHDSGVPPDENERETTPAPSHRHRARPPLRLLSGLQMQVRAARYPRMPLSAAERIIPGWRVIMEPEHETRYRDHYVAQLLHFFTVVSGWTNDGSVDSRRHLQFSSLQSIDRLSEFWTVLEARNLQPQTMINNLQGLAHAIRWLQRVVNSTRHLRSVQGSPDLLAVSSLSPDALLSAADALRDQASNFEVRASICKEAVQTDARTSKLLA